MRFVIVIGFEVIVNVAEEAKGLVRIKLRDPAPTSDHFTFGIWVPVTAAVARLGILIFDFPWG